MYRPLFVVLVALALAASAGNAQPPADAEIPQPCRLASPQPLSVLEKRRQELEREITRLSAGPSASKPQAESGVPSDALGETLRSNREELLKVTFQIACARAQNPEAGPPASRGPSKKASNVIEVTTFYATNRNLLGSGEPTKLYGTSVEPTLRYGRATVTIPLAHTPGAIELPSLWKLRREDPSKHFMVKSVVPLDTDGARRELAEQLDRSSTKALLVFVHGYNMSFAGAAMRTAQLAHDLKFGGVPFFFSWPSASQLLSYWQDEEAAQLSEGAFQQLLDDLSQLPATDIYILAHSMGNRIVSYALKARVDAGKETKHLREVLLAAPDINADLFRNVIAPKLTALKGTRTTIYASSSDLALKASKVVHGFRRLGETAGGVFTYPGLETIDASVASQATRAYGHFYLMDNAMVLRDVRTIIEQKMPAKQRGLSAIGQSPNVFWRLH